MVVVTLNGTHGEGGFGGASAAPVFHAVATEALRVMEVPKDLPDQLPPNTLLAAANVDDLAVADACAIVVGQILNVAAAERTLGSP